MLMVDETKKCYKVAPITSDKQVQKSPKAECWRVLFLRVTCAEATSPNEQIVLKEREQMSPGGREAEVPV